MKKPIFCGECKYSKSHDEVINISKLFSLTQRFPSMLQYNNYMETDNYCEAPEHQSYNYYGITYEKVLCSKQNKNNDCKSFSAYNHFGRSKEKGE